MLAPGETANAKVIQDIKNMLTASRIPGNQVTIEIVHADGPNAGSPFDLEDEDNYLQMFTITGSVPFDQITLLPGNYLGGSDLQAAITFRMGRTTLD